MTRTALVLPPNGPDLGRLAPVIAAAEAFVVTPETTWLDPSDGRVPNGYAGAFLEVARGRPVVGHGVSFSLASADHGRWIESVVEGPFRFEWLSDHAMATELAGENIRLPVALPLVAEVAAAMRSSLLELRSVAGAALVETSAYPFVWGDPMDEPTFLTAVTDASGLGILLDVHNVFTNATNFGFDPDAWIAALPLERVIEMHVSGGSISDPAWLDGKTVRLDSHDAAVPAEVWELLLRWAPRCVNLRQITLERLETTIRNDDVPLLESEIAEVRRIAGLPKRSAPHPPLLRDLPAASAAVRELERWYASALRCKTAPPAPRGWEAAVASLDRDGFRIAKLQVAKLRFERLAHGSPSARAHFDRDPSGFARTFAAYHEAVAPTFGSPHREAEAWATHVGGEPARSAG